MATATQETQETDAQSEKQAAAEAKAEKARLAAEKKAASEAKKAEREQAKAAKRAEQAEAKAKAQREKVESAAKEGEVSLDDITGTGEEGAITLGDVREAIKAKKAKERAERPKKAPMTLSQRRALLKLADSPITPRTEMNTTPLAYLESVGLAQSEEVLVDEPYTETVEREEPLPEPEGGFPDGAPTTKTVKEKVEKTRSVSAKSFSLTDLGRERAEETNKKWLDWKPAA